MTKQSKILIVGGYGYLNIGDEAILGGLLRYIENILGYDKNNIIVFSYNPQYTMNIHKVKATNRLYKTILKTDIIIIGGGELFGEYKNLFYKHLLLILTCKLLNKKIYLLGIGIDIKKKL